MKISIIIPCYNVEAYLRKCLDSILTQTIGRERLEIICVDDCSTDGTLEILMEYEQKYPETMILIPLSENGRQGHARNVGLAYASGEYILFVDADDWILPQMLEKMQEMVIRHPQQEAETDGNMYADTQTNARVHSHRKKKEEEAKFSGGYDVIEVGYQKVSSEKDIIAQTDWEHVSWECVEMTDVMKKRRYILQQGADTAVWGRLYRREFLLEQEIFFPEDTYMEDVFFSEKRMLLMRNCLRIHAPLYMYRVNENGTMYSARIREYYMDTPHMQDLVTRFALREGLLTDCRQEFMMLHLAKMAEPWVRMWQDAQFFSYENVQWIRREILEVFPDFWENPYLQRDRSPMMQKILEMMRTEHSAQELREMFYPDAQKRRVIDVLIAVAERGGVEQTIRIMIRELESETLHFRVVQMVWEGTRWIPEEAEFHPLLEGRNGHNLQEFADTYAAFLQKQEEKPDLILAVGWPYLCTVARAAVTYFAWDTKVVSWLHSGVERYEAAGYGGLEELEQAEYHLAISGRLQKTLEHRFCADRVFRVKNPVDLPRGTGGSGEHASQGIDSNTIENGEFCLPYGSVSFAAQEALETDLTIQARECLYHSLLYVGRLSKEKNIPLLLRNMRMLPDWNLDIVGDGEERERLEQMADALGIRQQIRFLGWQEDPWKFAARKDALVMSSIYEGFPLTAIEAMSRALPVISTVVDGIVELVEDGVTGWLYDIQQESSFVECIRRIEMRGYVVADRMACVCRARAYDSRTVMAQMRALLLRMM